ncbi:hypothetical protein [Achromobacter spanius]|uniref:hypothetical protein n=1 Tax=Achromobacter spanius TaxID=217203 RepID=UPI0012FE7314|nr:hypothetical protein [Achromobacter spanius]
MTQSLPDGFRAFDIGFFIRNPSRCTHPTMATARRRGNGMGMLVIIGHGHS